MLLTHLSRTTLWVLPKCLCCCCGDRDRGSRKPTGRGHGVVISLTIQEWPLDTFYPQGTRCYGTVMFPCLHPKMSCMGGEYRVKAKMILLKRGCLGVYLTWILFAVTLYWGSASAFKRSQNGHSGLDYQTPAQLFGSPSGAGKQQALDKTENKWA